MPRREANPYWDHFNKKDETIGICKYCSQCISYKSTTGNLRSHLKKKHPHILATDASIRPSAPTTQQMLPQTPQQQEIETTDSVVDFTASTMSSTTATADTANIASTSGTCTVPAKQRRQRTINSYILKPITKDMKKKLTEICSICLSMTCSHV